MRYADFGAVRALPDGLFVQGGLDLTGLAGKGRSTRFLFILLRNIYGDPI